MMKQLSTVAFNRLSIFLFVLWSVNLQREILTDDFRLSLLNLTEQ